jgi:argininosuccinate lyase
VKMWSGRFREPLDPEFDQWQRSLRFDWRLLPYEVAASRTHARVIAAAGVLTPHELTQIDSALADIATRFEKSGEPWVQADTEAEDIHHFVETALVDRVGSLGLKLHTGRSRNEQIATDLRLYIREQITDLMQGLVHWAQSLHAQAVAAGEAAMPAYTHLQRAEPVLVAHWLLAYVQMILRDVDRLSDSARRLNQCPLGSGAVAGATLPLDRQIAARELGFDEPSANSIDATSDRDFVVEYLQAVTMVGLHASRFAEEITLFATAEFGFVELPEAFSTGSSAMPQKKNPDLTELVRAKVGRLHGATANVTMLLKGLPLAYGKDLQEVQEPVFAASETIQPMITLLATFTMALVFQYERMQKACESGFLNAMAAATYLVHKGVPSRTAHEMVATAVRHCITSHCELGDLPLEILQQFGTEFGTDFYEAVTLRATLDCHDVIGGTATRRVSAALNAAGLRIAELLQPSDLAATARHGGAHAHA